MKIEITMKKLSINSINDDMLKFAENKGYKLPCVSIKHHYGKAAQFIVNYFNGNIIDYEMIVLGKNEKSESIYLIPA